MICVSLTPLSLVPNLMDHCAFIGLEDISDGLPSYREDADVRRDGP